MGGCAGVATGVGFLAGAGFFAGAAGFLAGAGFFAGADFFAGAGFLAGAGFFAGAADFLDGVAGFFAEVDFLEGIVVIKQEGRAIVGERRRKTGYSVGSESAGRSPRLRNQTVLALMPLPEPASVSTTGRIFSMWPSKNTASAELSLRPL